jgi:DNA ligase-1
MLLEQLGSVSRRAAATKSRLDKRALFATLFKGANADDVALAVSYLTGALPQGRIGLGPALVRDALGEAPRGMQGELTLRDVDARFSEIAGTSGKGSTSAKRRLFADLLGRAAAPDRDFLVRLATGELRQGALEAVVLESIADASGVDAGAVRRAAMLTADPALVAQVAFASGSAGLAEFRLELLSPIRPMLAQPADTLDAAFDAIPEAYVETKLDGARVQLHRDGDEVRAFTRQLNDVTQSLPEITAVVRSLEAKRLVLDGEVIALRPDGRPHPFQVTMRRFGRKSVSADIRRKLPLSVFLFDCLLLDDDTLIDRPYAERVALLAAAAPPELIVPRILTASAHEATRFMRNALDAGHEGVMVKAPDSLYAAGNRGADWLKVKQVHSLDLVVLAAEWGSGRRKGWLSNLHLGAVDGNDFVMLGKTFKGLTDTLLKWQTRELLELEISRDEHIVHVRPELVVEIAVNEIQHSPQYPAGMALRFARVKRYRSDKSALEADTIDSVRQLFEQQAVV